MNSHERRKLRRLHQRQRGASKPWDFVTALCWADQAVAGQYGKRVQRQARAIVGRRRTTRARHIARDGRWYPGGHRADYTPTST